MHVKRLSNQATFKIESVQTWCNDVHCASAAPGRVCLAKQADVSAVAGVQKSASRRSAEALGQITLEGGAIAQVDDRAQVCFGGPLAIREVAVQE